MFAAWNAWQQVYADLKFANRMGGGAIRRMLNRKLSMAWEKWQFEAEEMKRQQLLLRGLMRMIHAKMAAAMATWRQQAADAKRQARTCGGAIRRMLNRKLSMAWEKWQYEA